MILFKVHVALVNVGVIHLLLLRVSRANQNSINLSKKLKLKVQNGYSDPVSNLAIVFFSSQPFVDDKLKSLIGLYVSNQNCCAVPRCISTTSFVVVPNMKVVEVSKRSENG